MNIALVFPKSTFLIDPMVYPPLGLWYLASQLEAKGIHCDFFDLSVDKLPNDGEYDQLWVSATSPQIAEARKIGTTVKNWKRTATVLGGAGPWAQQKNFTGLGFDLLAVGECDHPDIVSKIINGAYFSKSVVGGNIYVAPPQTGMSHILPPQRRWSNMYHAFLEDHDGIKHPTTTMFTSRGCPMACAFCESGRNGVIWDRAVRYESLEIVESQLHDIARRDYTGVMFYDDILPLNKPRTLEILKLLKKYELVWRCFLRTDVIAKQGGFSYLKEMADAGLLEVLAGVETADNRIKNNIHKGTTIEQDTQALEWCKQLGIKFKASLILGLPGETRESMERTREWIFKYRPDRVDVNVLIPFPGTPITKEPTQYDVYWTEEYPEEFWYKGPRDDAISVVGTSNLAPLEIKEFHDTLIKDMEREGIPY